MPVSPVPIPQGAPRQRGGRACIPCRGAKCKCEPADSTSDSESNNESAAGLADSGLKACARCVKLQIQCEYAPNRRLGRPRRHPVPRPPGYIDRSATLEPALRVTPKEHVSPSPPHQDPAPFATQQPTESVDSYYTAIFNEYKRNVHPYVPIFPSNEADLERTIRFAPPQLLNAIVAITYPHQATNLQISVVDPVLSDIQAATLLTLVLYGRGDKEGARAILGRATRALQTIHPALLGIRGYGDTLPPMPKYGRSETDPIELWQKVWRECWALEIIISSVTGVHSFVLSQSPHHHQNIGQPQSSGSTPSANDTVRSPSIFTPALI
jgi:hypothetical protein